MRAVQAVYLALQCVTPVVLDQKLTIRCPHSVHALLSLGRASSVTLPRWIKWSTALELPNIVIEKATPSNPATLLSPSEAIPDGHDCAEIVQTLSIDEHLDNVPIQNPDLILYTDGSSFVDNGERKAGWAVTTDSEILASGALSPGTSAQQAELVALTKACELATDKTVNIYCNSRWVFGAVHDFRAGWQQRGFLTTAGMPIKNGREVENLLKALQLPQNVAVLKVKAHTKAVSIETKGNSLADQAAKVAAARTADIPTAQANQLQIVEHHSQLKNIAEMQNQCSREEKWEWMENGCKLSDDNIWRYQNKTVAPKALLPYLATQIHSVGHIGVSQMCSRFNTVWWTRGFRKHAEAETSGCVICQKHNSAPPIPSVVNRTPAPSGPFRELQCDYITLPKCKGYQDVLVIVDKFSRWVEAFPTKKGTAAFTAKVLVRDVIPRWGIPTSIDSDLGTHFTGQVCQEVCRLLEIQWHFHCPGHPQSSGMTERVNRTLKTRLAKYGTTGLTWVDVLPLVLCSIRSSANKETELSPFEVITGRPMSLPGTPDLAEADVHLMSDSLLMYCMTLTEAVQRAQNQVQAAWKMPQEGGHSVVPGQMVYVKKLQHSGLEPRWDGPFVVLLVTPSAVKLLGKTKWTHISYCKLAHTPKKKNLLRPANRCRMES